MRFDQELRGGDPRSLGRTSDVVREVLGSRHRLTEPFECLFDDDAVVRMRAGDALEKVAREQPDWIVPHLERLLTEVAAVDQPSVQWHLAQILGEVPLDDDQRRRAVRLLRANLDDAADWIVLNMTMESLTTLAADDVELQRWLVPALRRRLADRRPAVAKRAAKQLARLSPSQR